MSLVVAASCREGVVVAGDRCFATERNRPQYGASKVHSSRGVVFSVTGFSDIQGPHGPLVSLPDAIAAAVSVPFDENALRAAAIAALNALAPWAHTLVPIADFDDGPEICAVFFWQAQLWSAFTLRNEGGRIAVSDAICFPTTPDLEWRHAIQGMTSFVNEHVIEAGLLTARSAELIASRRKIGDVSKEEATAFVLNVQQAAERAMQTVPSPWRIGGGVDLHFVGRDARPVHCGGTGITVTGGPAYTVSATALVQTSVGTGTNGSVSPSTTSGALASANVTVAAGQHVDITLGVGLNTIDNTHPMDLQMVLVEDGTAVLSYVITVPPNAVSPFNTNMSGVFIARRSPSAGSHTYDLKVANDSSTTTVNWSQATIRAYVVGV